MATAKKTAKAAQATPVVAPEVVTQDTPIEVPAGTPVVATPEGDKGPAPKVDTREFLVGSTIQVVRS